MLSTYTQKFSWLWTKIFRRTISTVQFEKQIFRELTPTEWFVFQSGRGRSFSLVYTFFVEIKNDEDYRNLDNKIPRCLKILMKRHPLLRACVRQQPQSQPPRFFFCELQPTADGEVTPPFTVDLSTDYQGVMTSLVTQPFAVDVERPLWSVVYMPNVTSPFTKSEQEGNTKQNTKEAAIVLHICHTIVDGQSRDSNSIM